MYQIGVCIYIYVCITQSSAHNKADSRQHLDKHQKRDFVMRKNQKESRAYIKLIQRLETRRLYKSWDEEGIFDLVKIDAELDFRNASSQHQPRDKNRSCTLGSEQMRTHGMALLHVSLIRKVSKMDSQVIGRIRLERGARGTTATAGFES